MELLLNRAQTQVCPDRLDDANRQRRRRRPGEDDQMPATN